jgi:hypothetical protein
MVESILKDIVLGETDHFNEKFSLSNSGLEYPFMSHRFVNYDRATFVR